MKPLLLLPIALIFCACANNSNINSAEEHLISDEKLTSNSAIIETIEGMRAADQYERFYIIDIMKNDKISKPEKEKQIKIIGDTITNNDKIRTEKLKNILAANDIIQIAEFSPKTSHSAFLLITHATHDINFQKQNLSKAEILVKNGTLDANSFAILSDKIAIGEMKSQKYGTQLSCIDESRQMVGKPNIAQVEKAREELGLESLSEYIASNEKLYGKCN